MILEVLEFGHSVEVTLADWVFGYVSGMNMKFGRLGFRSGGFEVWVFVQSTCWSLGGYTFVLYEFGSLEFATLVSKEFGGGDVRPG